MKHCDLTPLYQVNKKNLQNSESWVVEIEKLNVEKLRSENFRSQWKKSVVNKKYFEIAVMLSENDQIYRLI